MVKSLFGHKKFAGKMVFSYQEKVNEKGEAVFGSIENGLWWKQKQVPFTFFLFPSVLLLFFFHQFLSIEIESRS